VHLHDVPDWFAELMVALAEAYPNHRLREAQVRVYYAVLADLSEAEVRHACSRAPKEYASFFPPAGELRKLVDLAPEDKALTAWVGLQQAASRVGSYQSLYCADAAVAAALVTVFGSWPSFCEQCTDFTSGPWLAKRQEFVAAYRAARRTSVPGQARLSGLCEDHEGAWVGLLGDGGEVSTARYDRQLAAAVEPRQLTEGDL
jgi:hypothetical protein